MTEGRARQVRIFYPYDPFPATEGSFRVVADQVETLRSLGYEVDLRTWLPREFRENAQMRAFRVARACVGDAASPELLYFPPSRMGRACAGAPVPLEIFNYSFAHLWLKRLPRVPGVRRVVYFHNLESELSAVRLWASINPLGAGLHGFNARRLRIHEADLASLTDEQWFVSRVDLDRYVARVPSAQVRLVPPGLDRTLGEARIKHFSAGERSHGAGRTPELVRAGLLGRYDFEPNRASLEWIVEQLAPALAARNFFGQIDVVGRGVPKELAARASRFAFLRIHGFVPDLESLWSQWSYTLVPHVTGSGVRIKLLESLGSGVPVLANPEAIMPIPGGFKNGVFSRKLSEPDAWAKLLSKAAPSKDRRELSVHGFPAELDLRQIYSFLA